MKYIELGLTSTTRAIHPVDQFLADLEAVSREAILHVDSRAKEMTILYQCRGDRAVLETTLAENDDVFDFEIVDSEDGFTAYIRAASVDSGSELVAVAHEHALIIETPIDVGTDGLAVRLVGTHDNLRRALKAVPDGITTTVRNAGPYAPSDRSLLGTLTERQLEVFRTAVDRGYYDMPRRATHKDLAGELDCSPSTVDEHLRKAESRVVSGLLG